MNQTGGIAMVTGNMSNAGTVTISGSGVSLTVGGSYTQVAGAMLTVSNGGVLDPTQITIEGGVFGGSGTVVGNVSVTGDTIHVGASPDPLHIEGPYSQTGGTITFEIDPNGHGGYLESSLLFDPGNGVSITGTKIVFDFLNGANPLAFFDSSAFNLDTFFTESD